MRLRAMATKELRQIARDRRTLFFLVFMPAMLLLLFGYALSFDVKNTRIGVLDLDGSSASRELLAALAAGDTFRVARVYRHEEEIDEGLLRGDVKAALVIPRGLGEALARGEAASVQALVDGTNSQSATIVQGYLSAFFQTRSIRLAAQRLAEAGRGAAAVPAGAEVRLWYNPELESSMFLIPGLIVFIMMVASTVTTALSIVRERERGTMEQLLVSPLHPVEVVVGKTLPYVFIALLSAAIVIAVGDAVFGVRVRGSYLLLLVACTLSIVAALGQGILISTITSSQQAAFQIAVLATMLPSMLLSGFVFPIRNMPEAIQAVTYVLPARYFVEVLRAVMLKGTGLAECWPALACVAAYAVLVTLVATARMSRARLV